MQPFREFGTPARPRVHLMHLEDLVLQGRTEVALDTLTEIMGWLDGESLSDLMLSVKWDGAPAVVFGPDPADGRFFVSTKAAFSQTPKLAKSHAEINELFDAEVASILRVCFDELPALNPTTPMQGDFLFGGPVSRQVMGTPVKGGTPLSFKPNLIEYGVPIQSDMAHRLQKARMGIALHTRLDGWVAQPMTEEDFECLGTTERVFVVDTKYRFNRRAGHTVTSEFYLDFESAIEQARACACGLPLLPSADFEEFGRLAELVPMFINNCVRSGYTPGSKGLFHWLGERALVEMQRRKGPNSQVAIALRFREMQEAVTANRAAWDLLFGAHTMVQHAKNLIIARMELGMESEFQTSINGYACGPEGFVVTLPRGEAFKLVNRAEFSRANMLSSRFAKQSLNTAVSGV